MGETSRTTSPVTSTRRRRGRRRGRSRRRRRSASTARRSRRTCPDSGRSAPRSARQQSTAMPPTPSVTWRPWSPVSRRTRPEDATCERKSLVSHELVVLVDLPGEEDEAESERRSEQPDESSSVVVLERLVRVVEGDAARDQDGCVDDHEGTEQRRERFRWPRADPDEEVVDKERAERRDVGREKSSVVETYDSRDLSVPCASRAGARNACSTQPAMPASKTIAPTTARPMPMSGGTRPISFPRIEIATPLYSPAAPAAATSGQRLRWSCSSPSPWPRWLPYSSGACPRERDVRSRRLGEGRHRTYRCVHQSPYPRFHVGPEKRLTAYKQ